MARDYTKNRRDNRQYQDNEAARMMRGGRHTNRYTDYETAEAGEGRRGRAGGRDDGRTGGREGRRAGGPGSVRDGGRNGLRDGGRGRAVGDREASRRGDHAGRGGRDRGAGAGYGAGAGFGAGSGYGAGSGAGFGQVPEGVIIGRNPVMEALKTDRGVLKVMIAENAEGSVKKIAAMARDKGITVQYADRNALDRAAAGGVHQGVVAQVSDFEYCEAEDIMAAAAAKGEDPFIIVLDGIEDPHNLGAIIRTADAVGAHGVIIPKRRAAVVTAVAEKSAAGATAYVPVARVSNIAQTLEELKKQGVWTVATDMDGQRLFDAQLTGPVAIVIGNEGKGISRLVKEKCDICVSMPMKGGVDSLNASNAAAVLMYEIVRQRG